MYEKLQLLCTTSSFEQKWRARFLDFFMRIRNTQKLSVGKLNDESTQKMKEWLFFVTFEMYFLSPVLILPFFFHQSFNRCFFFPFITFCALGWIAFCSALHIVWNCNVFFLILILILIVFRFDENFVRKQKLFK